MTSIEYIRKYKEPRAKIGLRVTYAGHPYRIANTSGDGLKLRSEILCHAKDDLLDYEPDKDVHNATLYRKMQQLEKDLAAAIEALREVITYDDKQARSDAQDIITAYETKQQ